MEDNYVKKMSNEVNTEVGMDNDVIIDEDIHKHYGQEMGKLLIVESIHNYKGNCFVFVFWFVIP